jgi:hypothetical protein
MWIGAEMRRIAAIVVAILVAATCVQASTAEAANSNWSCGLDNPGHWCQNSVWHNFISNGAVYNGRGSLYLCEKVIRRTNGLVYEQTCGYNRVGATFAPCNCGGLYALYAHFGNVAHRVEGISMY